MLPSYTFAPRKPLEDLPKSWTLWELNPRPFTYAKIDAKRLNAALVRCSLGEGDSWWKLTNHTPGEDVSGRAWRIAGVLETNLDQAPDDVKAKIENICYRDLKFVRKVGWRCRMS